MAQRGEHLFSSMFGMAVILSKDNPFEGPSFSSRNRFARIAWQITCLTLFRYTPAPLHAWRCLGHTV